MLNWLRTRRTGIKWGLPIHIPSESGHTAALSCTDRSKSMDCAQWLRTSRKTRLSIGSWLASSIQTRSNFQFRAAEKNGIQFLSANYVHRTDYSILESLQIENIVSVWLLPVLSELKCSSINSREFRVFGALWSCWKFWCMNNRRRCERTGFRPILCCAVGTPCVPSAELPIDRALNRSPSLYYSCDLELVTASEHFWYNETLQHITK